MSACVKLSSYRFFLIVVVRSMTQILFLQPLMVYQRTNLKSSLKPPQAYYVFGRAIGETVAVCCQFYAYQNMNIGDAAAIVYSSPFITGILAAIFLKERFTLFHFLATIVSFGGVILVARPPFIFGSLAGDTTQTHFAVAGIAFCGTICNSLGILSVRKLGNTVDGNALTYYFSIICCTAPLIITAVTGEFELPPCGSARWLLLFIGLLGFVGQLVFVKAIQLEEAMLIAVIRTLDVLFGYILEIIIFGSIPSILSIIGSLLVVSSACTVGLNKVYGTSWIYGSCKQSHNDGKTTEQSMVAANQSRHCRETQL
ncbi:expressed hypothetical protein [Trichoplax adhaerens]|uniref:EamA domain-containing protein n=1 Tax=Trichoplax adhaerens TaxID=10228 RepID=B3RLS4_TRIAD|nr:expressed hypothetical protein [Trichoplax adhaerens]EDV28835.1 expressed hypothetical protein [Trichoplax adhaerens]|eukprot:XP_002108037.1 expressed hypothetical protein [Trichoplax adhaerens]